MPTIYSRRHKRTIPSGAVYVGRPTKWGNPHTVGFCAGCRMTHTREEAIARFRAELSPDMKAAARNALRGKDLVCWCRPLACHADVLMEVANA